MLEVMMIKSTCLLRETFNCGSFQKKKKTFNRGIFHENCLIEYQAQGASLLTGDAT